MILAQLAAADVRSSWRVWAGLFTVCAVAAVAGSVPGVLIVTGLQTPGVRGLALLSIAGTTAAFGLISVLIVVSAVVRLTAGLLERTYALWQLAGVTPRGVRVTMLVQTTVVATCGATVGAVAATILVPALVSASVADASGLAGVDVVSSGPEAIAVALFTIAAAVLAALPGSRRAANTAPLLLLGAGPVRRRTPVVRITVVVLLTTLAAGMLAGLPRSVPQGAAPALLIGPVLIAVVAVLGRWIGAPTVRLWTAAVPGRTSVAFGLARATVRWATSRSDTTLAALLIAIGLPAALVGGQRTAASAAGATSVPAGGSGATLLILSGPVLLAAIGAAATAAMATRDRAQEREQLRAVGASPGLTLGVAVLEGLVLSGTGLLIAGVTVVIAVCAEWAVLVPSYPSARPTVPVDVVLGTGVFCTVLVVASTLLPAFSVRGTVGSRPTRERYRARAVPVFDDHDLGSALCPNTPRD